MADGSSKAIKDIVIGDVLAEVPNNKSPVVTSVFRFAGGSTPMVRIHDVVVSAAHYVLAGSAGMVTAEAHPEAVWSGSVPEIVCLNVSGHRFRVGADGLLVADYDEHESASVVMETQRMATRALNGKSCEDEMVLDYSLGIGGSTEVLMADNGWKRMDAIAIGDEVKHSGKVLGIVCEQCDTTVVSPSGIVFSAAQLVYDLDARQWKRSANRWSRGSAGGAKKLYTIFTMNSGVISIRKGGAVEFIRDYREAPLPEMESAYEKEFLVAH